MCNKQQEPRTSPLTQAQSHITKATDDGLLKHPTCVCPSVCVLNVVIVVHSWNSLHCKRAIRKIEYNYLPIFNMRLFEMCLSEQVLSLSPSLSLWLCLVGASDDHVLHVRILNKLHELSII